MPFYTFLLLFIYTYIGMNILFICLFFLLLLIHNLEQTTQIRHSYKLAYNYIYIYTRLPIEILNLLLWICWAPFIAGCLSADLFLSLFWCYLMIVRSLCCVLRCWLFAFFFDRESSTRGELSVYSIFLSLPCRKNRTLEVFFLSTSKKLLDSKSEEIFNP